jgi:hypothetical protein
VEDVDAEIEGEPESSDPADVVDRIAWVVVGLIAFIIVVCVIAVVVLGRFGSSRMFSDLNSAIT